MATSKQNQSRPNHAKLTAKLLVAVVAMFGFGFALVPLYDILCEQLGINGKTSTVAAAKPDSLEIDTSRTIRIELMSHNNGAIPWEFYPSQQVLEVHPGQVIQTHYVAKNLSQNAMVGQAVPSVSPGLGATHFNKIECFCFNSQPLAASEQVDMGLLFYIEHDLPETIHTLTLSYTLYDITGAQQSSEVASTSGSSSFTQSLLVAANAAHTQSGDGITLWGHALNLSLKQRNVL